MDFDEIWSGITKNSYYKYSKKNYMQNRRIFNKQEKCNNSPIKIEGYSSVIEEYSIQTD